MFDQNQCLIVSGVKKKEDKRYCYFFAIGQNPTLTVNWERSQLRKKLLENNKMKCVSLHFPGGIQHRKGDLIWKKSLMWTKKGREEEQKKKQIGVEDRKENEGGKEEEKIERRE